MSLTNLLRNKTEALLLGLALNACGDTNNSYYTNGSDGKVENTNQINTCEDVAARLYECNYNDVKTDDRWNVIVRECSPKYVDFFKNAPLWIDCIEQNSCEYINAGNCDQYMVDY